MAQKWWKFWIGLPAAVLIYVPLVLMLLEFRGIPTAAGEGFLPLTGFILLWGGAALIMWAYAVLLKNGEAQPIKNMPTAKLVTSGPYHWVRNPMSDGVTALLCGEALYFGSWYVTGWAVLVTAAMVYYVKKVEEYRLANQFGQPYIEYKMDVGGWWPKIRR